MVFMPLSTVFQSYHGDSSHYSCLPGSHTNSLQTIALPDLNPTEHSFKTDFCTGFSAPNSFGFMGVTLVTDLECFRKCDFPVKGAQLYKVFSPQLLFQIP